MFSILIFRRRLCILPIDSSVLLSIVHITDTEIGWGGEVC